MAWKDVKKYSGFEAWPSGNYPVALTDYEVTTTQPSKGSKLMFAAHFTVVDNDHPSMQDFIGKAISDWYVVGSDNDADVQDEEETLGNPKNIGVQKIKALAYAAEVGVDDDAELTVSLLTDVLDQATGCEITALVKRRGKGSDASHNVNGYVRMGEVPVGLTGGAEEKSKEKKSSFGAAKKQESAKSAQTMIKKAKEAKAAIKSSKVVEVEVDEDEEEALPPPKKSKPSGKIEKAKTLPCPLKCGKMIEYDNLAVHVDQCTGADDEDEDDDN